MALRRGLMTVSLCGVALAQLIGPARANAQQPAPKLSIAGAAGISNPFHADFNFTAPEFLQQQLQRPGGCRPRGRAHVARRRLRAVSVPGAHDRYRGWPGNRRRRGSRLSLVIVTPFDREPR